jgi:Fe-S-cluster containining protein
LREFDAEVVPDRRSRRNPEKIVQKTTNPGMIARPDTAPPFGTPMKPQLIAAAELDRLETWQKYSAHMCGGCVSSCCTLPVEVKIKDLIRIGIVDEFERGDPPKNIAKRLQKEGIVERYNNKSEIFTLQRMSNNDCLYLDRKTRFCTIYDKRPDTCRNHPKIGPRPGYCAYKPKEVVRETNFKTLDKF